MILTVTRMRFSSLASYMWKITTPDGVELSMAHKVPSRWVHDTFEWKPIWEYPCAIITKLNRASFDATMDGICRDLPAAIRERRAEQFTVEWNG